MNIILIAAVAKNRAIGFQNALLWRIPEDMKRFRSLTMGHACIMGRKTWESLPEKHRPLSGRLNIIISHQTHFKAPGAVVVHTLRDALFLVEDEAVFIIGGASIYRQALPLATQLEITEVDDTPDGDVFFPEIDSSQWIESSREKHTGYDFVHYRRKNH